jgi:hypothetical protein
MISGYQRIGELSPEGESFLWRLVDAMRRWRAVFGHKIDSVSRYGLALAIGWHLSIHTDPLAPLYYSSHRSLPLFLTAFPSPPSRPSNAHDLSFFFLAFSALPLTL